MAPLGIAMRETNILSLFQCVAQSLGDVYRRCQRACLDPKLGRSSVVAPEQGIAVMGGGLWWVGVSQHHALGVVPTPTWVW